MSADQVDRIVCPNCGAENPPGRETCFQCGKVLPKASDTLMKQIEDQNEAGLKDAREEVRQAQPD